jgi:hypothetical protein
MVSSILRSDLAPTGKMRVGINYGNPVLASKDPGSGELRGVAVDLAGELGRRVEVPLELLGFESAGKMFDAVKDRCMGYCVSRRRPGSGRRDRFHRAVYRNRRHLSCAARFAVSRRR